VEGGYRVTASAPFGSLASHADWLWLLFVDATEPGEADAVPVPRIACFPAAAVQVLGNWAPTGLRATGSHDYEVVDTFVADAFVLEMSTKLPPNARFPEPLFQLPLTANQLMIGALASGAAQGALDWVLDLAQGKVPAFMSGSLRERPVAQSRLGRAQALLSAARAYARQMTAQMWAEARGEVAPDPSLKGETQLAGTFAVDASAEALELVRRVAGTSAITEDGPLARVVRDMAVLTQHAFVSDSRYESVGQTMLGLESDWMTLNL
jgi:alkylation response protein AidB-like acyl-CoA dehydrogenase